MLVTNFSKNGENKYRVAIEKYKLLKGYHKLEIEDKAFDMREELLRGCKSLHIKSSGQNDLSFFWEIFNGIQTEDLQLSFNDLLLYAEYRKLHGFIKPETWLAKKLLNQL